MKRVHFESSNIEKLLGKMDRDSVEEAYFRLAFENCPVSGCACEETSRDNSLSTTAFTRLKPCPYAMDCQSLNQWQFNFKTMQINRFFSRLDFRIKNLTLYFLPIGPFPEFIYKYKAQCGLGIFQLLCEYLRLFFTGCQVVMLAEKNIQSIRCKHRKHSFTKKDQYLVQDFFPFLKSCLPKDGCCIIGLSWFDLYPCEDLNFVLGQASYQHFSCVASFGRFDPTNVRGFLGNDDGIPLENLKDISCVDNLLIYKLIKVVSHEVCHVFGLAHCAVFSCLMNESKSSLEALKQPMILCPLCMKKIYKMCRMYPEKKERFRVRRHLAAILHFLEVVFVNEESENDNPVEGTVATVTSQRISDTVNWIKNTLSLLK